MKFKKLNNSTKVAKHLQQSY